MLQVDLVDDGWTHSSRGIRSKADQARERARASGGGGGTAAKKKKKKKTAQASWNGRVIAETDDTSVVVDGNIYFPLSSLNEEFFSDYTAETTQCNRKGAASYRDIVVDGKTNENAVWE
jgi:uncharacterized protein (DUF427 family)